MNGLQPGMTTKQKAWTAGSIVVLLISSLGVWKEVVHILGTLNFTPPPPPPPPTAVATTLGLFAAGNSTSAHCNVSQPVLLLHSDAGDSFTFYSVDGNSYTVKFTGRVPQTNPNIPSSKVVTINTPYSVKDSTTLNYFPYEITSSSCPKKITQDIGIIITH